MKKIERLLVTAGLLWAVASPLALTGCGQNRYYRAYDPYYGDYHTWSPAEDGYYHQYYVYRGAPYRDYRGLNRAEQNQYWQWRHQQHEAMEHQRHEEHERH